MAQIYHNQITPAANTLTPVVTMPASRVMQNPLITITNFDTVPRWFSLAIAVGGAADAPGQYHCLMQRIEPGGSPVPYVFPGVTLEGGDVIRCKTDSAAMNFQIHQTVR